MKKTFFSRFAQLPLTVLGVVLFNFQCFAQSKVIKDPDVIGRWDLTIQKGDKTLPSWLEVQKSGNHTFVGRFTADGGSARPISEVKVTDRKYSFSIPPQW